MNYPKREEAGEQGDAGSAATETAATTTTTAAGDVASAGVKTGDATGTPAAVVEGTGPTWPADWRTQLAAGNEKEVKQLERYTSPKDIWAKARALEQRLSSGELKASVPFPDKGTPEQQTSWRTENGIPEAPDKYTIDLGEGVVLGDADKPIVDDFLKHMHAKNLPSSLANETMKWYMDFAERQAEARYESDMQAKQQFEDTMRADWGNEFRTNMNSVGSILDLAPEGFRDRFMQGRMADGTPFGSDPDALRWLANMARQINPITTIVPGAGANVQQAIDDEIGKLEGMMGHKGSEYWKGETAEKNQSRYRELLDARDRNKGRAA